MAENRFFSFHLIAILLSTLFFADPVQNIPTSKFEIPALGRSARLGEFYDAVSESFLGLPIFREKLPAEYITTSEIPWTSSEYTMANSLEEKSHLLKISLELTLSIFFGLIKIRGSAEYMNEVKTTTRSVAVFMDYQVRTVKESIEPLYEQVQNIIAQEYLQNINATHIVIGIEYGGDVVVKFEDKNIERKSSEAASGSLGVAVQALMGLFGASGSGTVSMSPTSKNTGKNLNIKVFGDVSYGTNNPMNFEQVQKFIEQVPALVQKSNDGKGKPMTYVLFPLDVLRAKANLTGPATVVNTLDSTLVQEFIQISDRIQLAQQSLNELMEDFSRHAKCLTRDHAKKVENIQDAFDSTTNRFKADVKKLMVEVRSGQRSPDLLEKVKTTFLEGAYSPDAILTRVNTEFSGPLEKIRLCQTMINAAPSSGPIEYYSEAASLLSFHFKNTGKNVFVLYYSIQFIQENQTVWNEESTRFFRLAQNPANKMAIMDCEFSGADCPAQNIRRVTLVQFKNGRKIDPNSVSAAPPNKFSQSAKMMEIPALGTAEKLGALYSEKSQRFLGPSLLNSEVPFSEKEPAMGIDHSILHPKQTMLDKLRALQVPMELRLNILTGAGNGLPSTGALRSYLRAGDSPYPGVVSRLRTLKESVNMSSPQFQSGLNLDRALNLGATHYVHSIIYGATTVFQIQGPKNEDSDQGHSSGQIKGDLQAIQNIVTNTFLPSNDTCPNSLDNDQGIRSKAVVTFLSDVPSASENKFGPMGNLTRDIAQALQNFRTSFAGASGSEEARGVTSFYVLYPLHQLEPDTDDMETSGSPGSKVNVEVTPTYQLDFLQHFEEIQHTEESLSEFRGNLSSSSKMCTPVALLEEVGKFQEEFQSRKNRWISGVKTALENQKEELSVFHSLENDVRDKLTSSRVLRELNAILQTKFGDLLRKRRLCQWAQGEGVGYLGLDKMSSLDQAFWSDKTNDTVYLLFFKDVWTQGDIAQGKWIHALTVFFSYLNVPGQRLFLVDCDDSRLLKESCDQLEDKEPSIVEYRNGVQTNQNVLKVKIQQEGNDTNAGEVENAGNTGEEAKGNSTVDLNKFKILEGEILCVEKELEKVITWLKTDFTNTLSKTQDMAEEYCGVEESEPADFTTSLDDAEDLTCITSKSGSRSKSKF